MQKRGPAFWLFVVSIFLASPAVTFLPAQAGAQVVINEVMYNPQGSDSGREWIELYNEGQTDVSLVGGSGKGSWRINDGSNHTLTDPAGGTGRGSLVVPAGSYLIIASDPNDFISGEYSGGSYSVVKSSISLNNNGATLTLLDGSGTTVDTVTYNPSQGGNDDSSSLQKQADGSWIAALPTPGTTNSITPYVPPPSGTGAGGTGSSTDTEQTAGSQSSIPTPSYVPPPTPDLFADAGGDRTAIVGADVEFDASAYDKTQTLLDPTMVRFLWNFGDGSSAEGDSVLHHFSYPGRYAVILTIAQDKNAASDRIVVTAEPASLSFSLLSDSGVQVQNLAGHDLDLSGWIVRQDQTSFSAQFMLPDHTEILSGSSLDIAASTLTFRASSSTQLVYPNGVFALAIGGTTATSSSGAPEDPVAAPIAPVVHPQPTAVSTDAYVEVAQTEPDATDTDTLLDTDEDTQDIPQATTSFVQTAAAAEAPASNMLWWIGIGGLALAGGAAIIAAGYFKRGEWDIVEESDN